MAFFDALASKSKDVAEKAKKMAEVAGLNSQISSKENEIKNVYREIGQTIYSNKETWKEVDLSELFGKVEAAEAEIARLKEEILVIKDIKICTQCNAEIDKEAAFCPKCGAPVPVVEAPVAEEAVVDIVAEEVAAEPVVEAEAEEVAAPVAEEAAPVQNPVE
uniref:zinc ribbon domain-containing protein n=1 Tax=Acetatifactor sp. TaxID=1872090 RepID=UPI0040570B41